MFLEILGCLLNEVARWFDYQYSTNTGFVKQCAGPLAANKGLARAGGETDNASFAL